MNKYLSYEKSKRLAELGYKLNNPGKYWCQTGYNYLEKKDTWGLCANKIWIDEGLSKHTGKEPVIAPDCHDLLMELQKLKLNWANDFEFHPIYDVFTCRYKDQYFDDPNPVEALGAALIKLLEEKNGG